MARNFVRRIGRRERTYEPLPGDNALASFSSRLVSAPEALAGQLIRNQVVERVQSAIATLPEHYRQAVVLCDLCELSYEEAASRLRCALGTIRSRLNRAHALLAEKLEPLRGRQAGVGATGSEGCLI